MLGQGSQPDPIRSKAPTAVRGRSVRLGAWPLVAALAVAAAVWGVLDVRQRGRSNPADPQSHMTDFTVYTEAGAAFFDGRPPYEVANLRGWKYYYPPMFALVVAPLHPLATEDQVTVWFLLSLLACWGCYRESRRILGALGEEDSSLAGRLRAWFPLLAVAVLAAAMLPALNCLQRGQVGIVKLYLVLLGFRLIVENRSWWGSLLGGVVLAAPIVLKLTPLLPVCFVLFVELVAILAARRARQPLAPRPWRPLVAASLGLSTGLVLLVFLVPATLIGWDNNLRHLGTFSRLVLTAFNGAEADRYGGNLRSPRNQSLINGVYRAGNWAGYALAGGPNDALATIPAPPPMPMDTPAVGEALFVVRVGLLLALLAVGVRLGREGDRLGLAAGLGLGSMAMLVVSPVSWGHHFVFLVPPVLFVPLWLDRRGARAAATVMAVVPGLLTVLHYAVLDWAGRGGLLAFGCTAWFLAACVLVAAAESGSYGLKPALQTA